MKQVRIIFWENVKMVLLCTYTVLKLAKPTINGGFQSGEPGFESGDFGFDSAELGFDVSLRLSTVVVKLLIASKRRCPSLKVGTFGM